MTNDDSQNPGGGDWFDGQGPPPQADPFEQQLGALYAKYGRPAPTADELTAHRGNPGGLAAVEAMLKQANGGVTPGTATAPTGDGDTSWIEQALTDAQSTDDRAYWINKWKSGELGTDKAWVIDAINHGDGALAVRNGTAQKRGASGGGNQYASMAGFGAPPAPYQSNANAPVYQAPEVPSYLSQPYVAPTWQGGDFKTPDKPLSLQSEFKAPTLEDLQASPGYGARMDAGFLALNRSAAAKGSVLSGGTQKVLNRYGQDYASNEYSNLFGQRVTERGIADQEYGADVNNAANQFGTNFSVFQTGANNALAARQQNEGEYQANVVGPAQQSFANRYASYLNDNARTLNDYLTNYGIQHTADTDYWNRLKDVSGSGLDAAKNSRAA